MDLFEVFEEIRVKPDLENVFKDVDVKKITASRSTGKTVVHLCSKRLLEYHDLEEMEAALTTQFFGRVGQKVELSVEYQLSGQYNPETLWNLYQESVIEELGKESRMASFLLKKAEIIFDLDSVPAKMCLEVEDTFVNRTLLKDLKQFLETMYEKRFGFSVQVEDSYCEPVEKNRQDIKQESIRGTIEEAAVVQKTEPKPAVKAAKVETAKKTGNYFNKEKKDFSKFVKKKLQDDPDIFYGRAFEGDVTPLSEIQDEIGEVVCSVKFYR